MPFPPLRFRLLPFIYIYSSSRNLGVESVFHIPPKRLNWLPFNALRRPDDKQLTVEKKSVKRLLALANSQFRGGYQQLPEVGWVSTISGN